MRLLIWPVEPARSLGRAIGRYFMESGECDPWEAAAALAEDRCDVALVPTLDVLRDPSAFDVVPGVALVGTTSPNVTLVVGSALDAVRSLAFDPRFAQEALLAAVLLREHYGAEPAFAADDPAAPLADRLVRHDAALIPAGAANDLPEGVIALDLGAEWLELTTRPFVWGLLAARAGTLALADGRSIAVAARAAEPPEGWQFTLAGYGHDGLAEFAGHLFFHGALPDIPELTLVDPPPEAGTPSGS
jgi:predicted solute-binding protein